MRLIRSAKGFAKIGFQLGEWEYLTRLVEISRGGLIAGMDFRSALEPMQHLIDLYAQRPDRNQVATRMFMAQNRTTRNYGREVILTATPSDLQPIVDCCAIVIDDARAGDARAEDAELGIALALRALLTSYGLYRYEHASMCEVYAPKDA